jgi:3-oxoacyl-[acyl-carrier-protein] synthase-3
MDELTQHLLKCLGRVQRNLGGEVEGPDDPDVQFADVLDSMGLVEFLALLAEDYGVRPDVIEECAGRHFGTVAELARCLRNAGLALRRPASHAVAAPHGLGAAPLRLACWLAATAVRLPSTVQGAAAINAALRRPVGWLEEHAGINSRRLWGDEDPVIAAAEVGRDCLHRAGVLAEEVGTLLVTAEAPPLLVGLAAALHHRLDLRPEAVALEIGGACTGFLAALHVAQALLPRAGVVLLLAVEAPSRHFRLEPGPAGEAAALFGDGAAACVLCVQAPSPDATPMSDVLLGCDGSAAALVRVERPAGDPLALHLDGIPLASRAVRAMVDAVSDCTRRHGLTPADLDAVLAHGGNGRLPALLARRLGLPSERVRSETAHTGNLGSVSLPLAWEARTQPVRGPMVWTAVGAGLTWGATLLGGPPARGPAHGSAGAASIESPHPGMQPGADNGRRTALASGEREAVQ